MHISILPPSPLLISIPPIRMESHRYIYTYLNPMLSVIPTRKKYAPFAGFPLECRCRSRYPTAAEEAPSCSGDFVIFSSSGAKKDWCNIDCVREKKEAGSSKSSRFGCHGGWKKVFLFPLLSKIERNNINFVRRRNEGTAQCIYSTLLPLVIYLPQTSQNSPSPQIAFTLSFVLAR